uniref:trichoplein keratin filament-binding protein-like n=1 Tax=Myxine glutinosa TaxID=7769 RepID=UPI00358F2E6C
MASLRNGGVGWTNSVTWERRMSQKERQEKCRREWDHYSRQKSLDEARATLQTRWSQDMKYGQVTKPSDARQSRLMERRARLSLLLQTDQARWETEMALMGQGRGQRNTLTIGEAKDVKARVEALIRVREERRNKVAKQMVKERWRRDIPQLRQAWRDCHLASVAESWDGRCTELEKLETVRGQERTPEAETLALERAEKARCIEEERCRERERQKIHAEMLQKQMAELKEREEEAKHLEREHVMLMREQERLEVAIRQRKMDGKQREQAEPGHRLRKQQVEVRLRQRAREVQQDLEQDKKLLEAMEEAEEERDTVSKERREKGLAESTWLCQVLEQQIDLEKEREARMVYILLEEAERELKRREEKWERERMARVRLMQQLLQDRAQQVQARLIANRAKRKESIKNREDLIGQLEADRQKDKQAGLKKTMEMGGWKDQLAAQVEEKSEHLVKEDDKQREGNETLRLEEERAKAITAKMEDIHLEDFNQSFPRPQTAWT